MKASQAPNAHGDDVRGVAWLSAFLRDKLQGDPMLRSIAIRGEVSNFKVSALGNLNFALTEGTALLQCFAWEDDFLTFPEFKNGAKIVALGSISTYVQRSVYQLVVEHVRLDGIGDVHQLFEERKKRLAAEGLFDAARKRPLPAFPFRVALVSSKRSEGATDFLTRLGELRPHVRVEWCETSVQGPSAPAEIVGAIGRASQLDVDLIVVTRGGGSFEDLFTFSDENVVRAIARARHPVISAVGHTVNQQLADFAADFHAETPSAAAERVGLETRALRERLEDRVRRARGAASRHHERLESRLGRALTRSKLDNATLFLLPQQQRLESAGERLDEAATNFLRSRREHVGRLGEGLGRFDPRLALANRARRLGETAARLESATRERLRQVELRLRTVTATLNGNDPEAILQKGYAIVTLGGRIVREPDEVPIGATIDARVARGTLSARVESKQQGTNDGNERSG